MTFVASVTDRPRAPLARYHALDALRAAMMLLGLVLHAGASYTVTPLAPVWPYQDAQTHVAFDLLLFFIHLFRMPVFFVMAGFFGGLLHARDGVAGFTRNRLARVLVPLVVFWIAVMPLNAAGFAAAIWRGGGALPIAELQADPWLRRPVLGHLWFLYDLLIFYAAAALATPLLARLPMSLTRRADELIGARLTSVAGIVALAGVTALALVAMDTPGIDTSMALVPPLRVLAAYGLFFAYGWCLFRRRDRLDAFAARWKPWLASGAAAGVGALLVAGVPSSAPTFAVAGRSFVTALSIWLLVAGITGMFLARLNRHRPAVRYLSDASYWMYLTHLPLTIWFPALLAQSTAPAPAKYAVVLTATIVVTLVTYHYLVRATPIGALLNGRARAAQSPLRKQESGLSQESV